MSVRRQPRARLTGWTPFDDMRDDQALAPRDMKLNETRWHTGEALRRVHRRAQLDRLRSESTGMREYKDGVLPADEKLRRAIDLAGPATWPILVRVCIEGGAVRDCRILAPKHAFPWSADAVIKDRLRTGLDRIENLMGITRA